MNNIPWATLFDLLLKAIAKCQEKDPDEVIRQRLNNPGGRVLLSIRRNMKKETNLRGKELREASLEAFNELKNMSSEEIDDLIAEANEEQG